MDKADDEKLTKAVHIERPTKEDALKVNAETARVIAHSLAPWQAVEAYPNALFWCLMVSMCVIMEGTCSRSSMKYNISIERVLLSFPRTQATIRLLSETSTLTRSLRNVMANSSMITASTSSQLLGRAPLAFVASSEA